MTPAPLRKPEPPLPGDCCGDGCPRCVLDVYEEALAAWERQQAALLPKADVGCGERSEPHRCMQEMRRRSEPHQ